MLRQRSRAALVHAVLEHRHGQRSLAGHLRGRGWWRGRVGLRRGAGCGRGRARRLPRGCCGRWRPRQSVPGQAAHRRSSAGGKGRQGMQQGRRRQAPRARTMSRYSMAVARRPCAARVDAYCVTSSDSEGLALRLLVARPMTTDFSITPCTRGGRGGARGGVGGGRCARRAGREQLAAGLPRARQQRAPPAQRAPSLQGPQESAGAHLQRVHRAAAGAARLDPVGHRQVHVAGADVAQRRGVVQAGGRQARRQRVAQRGPGLWRAVGGQHRQRLAPLAHGAALDQLQVVALHHGAHHLRRVGRWWWWWWWGVESWM